MHARRTGWQRLAIIALAVACLAGTVAVALADANPPSAPDAPVSGVPTVGADQTAVPPRDGELGGVESTVRDLNDVASIAVVAPDEVITVAYTVEPRDPDAEAEVITERVDDAADAQRRIAQLEQRPRVVAAEIDTLFAALGDPQRTRQWGLETLQADRVWAEGNACGQTIAVIDSGVDGDHPDLQGVVLRGKNLVSRGIGAVDRSGHGTAVAGVAAAAHDNGVGISGMAPGARVLPIGIEDAAGQMRASDLAQAIRYAIVHDATVINLSLGGPVRSSNVEYWLREAVRAGIPVVAAAGNAHDQGNPKIWPAASPSTIAVGAIAPTGVWATFSSTGDWVDLTAPGVAVLTTARSGGYVADNGTSLAAPFVTATVAMLQARDPALTPRRVSRLLTANATDHGPRGVDARFGHGVVDPVATLAALGGRPAPCFTDIEDLELAPQIERLGLAGITDGCAARKFCPAKPVTRGQMATFLSRTIGQPATDADFFDDDDRSPHEPGINRLALANIAQGCTATGFCPNAPVTRGQMAALVDRALDLPAVSVDAFDDDRRNAHEASINALAAAGITSGCDAASPELFCPDDTLTRAQMAAFLARTMDHRP